MRYLFAGAEAGGSGLTVRCPDSTFTVPVSVTTASPHSRLTIDANRRTENIR